MARNQIPKVDDGIKGQKECAYEDTQAFYRRYHIPEFIRSSNGGKFLRFEFGSALDAMRSPDEEENDNIRKLSYVEVNKKSFLNNINGVARYINYFIEYFDPDDELITNYFYFMYSIMNTEVELELNDFVMYVRSYFGTESMIEKIANMVEYNTDKSMFAKSDRASYDPSLQLTENHLKAIMGLSCLHKFIIPIVCQYINLNKNNLILQTEIDGEIITTKLTDKEFYFYVFTSFLPCFDKVYDINLYNKLYHTSTTRISKTENRDSVMWGRRARVGVSPETFSNTLMRDLFIDISQKVIFNKSAIVFIHVCFDRAIRNELIQQDKYEYTEMEVKASDSVNETLTRWDQWINANPSGNEQTEFRANAVIRDLIIRKAEEAGVDLTDPETFREFDFYRENISALEDPQLNLLLLYYSSDAGGYDAVKHANRAEMTTLIILMKADMTKKNYAYIPQFVSGKMDISNAKRYNKKKIEKAFQQHVCYNDWIEQYGDAKDLLNPDKVYAMVKSLISCPIRVVDYRHPDINGKLLAVHESNAVDELMRFLLSI